MSQTACHEETLRNNRRLSYVPTSTAPNRSQSNGAQSHLLAAAAFPDHFATTHYPFRPKWSSQ